MCSIGDNAMQTANPRSHANAHGSEHFSQLKPPVNAQNSPSGADTSFSARSGLLADEVAGEGSELEVSENEDINRPNRFHGPASTWRNHTYEERQLAAAFAQQRANNLSIHLYNAHALKARARRPNVPNITPWTSKRRWVAPDQPKEINFQPDPNWTAWPLPPDEVPRRGEDFGAALPIDEDGETYRKDVPWTPSADLHQEMLALMLRKAKDRFMRRQWTESELRLQHGDWTRLSNENQHASVAEGGPDDLETVDVESEPPARPNISERTFTSSDVPKPNFLADDEEADIMLRSSIRNILTKLDELLLGLHKSRHGHRRGTSGWRFHLATRASNPRPKVASSRDHSGARPNKRRETSGGPVDLAVASNSSSSDYSESESSAANRKSRRPSGPSTHPLGLRDWSEILGLASLVGWNPAVIDRAARRCASLFGEGISFRTMPEMAVDDLNDKIIHYVPEMIPASSELGSGSESEREEGSILVIEGLFCPFQNCARHHAAYEKAWRWREHLRRSHKLRPDEIEKVESGIDRPSKSSNGKDGRAAQSSTTTNMKMGGIHTDDFLQPIRCCRRRGKDKRPRRRKNIAEHVSKELRLALNEERPQEHHIESSTCSNVQAV